MAASPRVPSRWWSARPILALQTLARVARDGEPGIFVAFEEPAKRILANAASFGWGLPALMRRRMLMIDARLPQEAVQSGNFEGSSKGTVSPALYCRSFSLNVFV